MSGLRVFAIIALIVGLVAWFAFPLCEVDVLSIIELGATGFEALWFSLTALFEFFSELNEFDEARQMLFLVIFVSGFPLLCLIGSLNAVRKEDYKDLILCSASGVVLMLFLLLLFLAAEMSVFGSGYIVILLALALTLAVSIPLYRDNPSTPKDVKQVIPTHTPVQPNAKFVDASGERLYQCYRCGRVAKRIEFDTVVQGDSYRGICRRCTDTGNAGASTAPAPAAPQTDLPTITCCQCGKTAKRTEFYIIGINGNDKLGVCHKCYGEYY